MRKLAFFYIGYSKAYSKYILLYCYNTNHKLRQLSVYKSGRGQYKCKSQTSQRENQ